MSPERCFTRVEHTTFLSYHNIDLNKSSLCPIFRLVRAGQTEGSGHSRTNLFSVEQAPIFKNTFVLSDYTNWRNVVKSVLAWIIFNTQMSMTDLDQRLTSLNIIDSCYGMLTTPSTKETRRTVLFAEHYRMSWKYLFPQNIVECSGKEFLFKTCVGCRVVNFWVPLLLAYLQESIISILIILSVLTRKKNLPSLICVRKTRSIPTEYVTLLVGSRLTLSG